MNTLSIAHALVRKKHICQNNPKNKLNQSWVYSINTIAGFISLFIHDPIIQTPVGFP